MKDQVGMKLKKLTKNLFGITLLGTESKDRSFEMGRLLKESLLVG